MANTHPTVLIPGDGIGPEVTEATLKILKAAGADFEYDMQLAGMSALESVKSPLPEATVESILRNGLCLKGPLTTPIGSGFRSINVALRKEFGLYANVRPVRTIVPGGRYDDIDLHYVGRQELEDDPFRTVSRGYLVFDILVEKRLGKARVFLNGKNLLDAHQTRWSPLLRPDRSPQGKWTTDVWAPLEGRVFSGGVHLFL